MATNPLVAALSNQQQSTSPDSILRSVIAANKGFSGVYNPGNTAIVLASKDRADQNKKFGGGGGLEYWPPDEEGDSKFPRPTGLNGKHVLEIYDPSLQKNPQAMSDAIYGDLIHGMPNDPKFAKMRQDFIANYNPQVKAFNDKLLAQKVESPASLHDMYIRGRLAKNQGDEWNDPKRYSQKQLQILDMMQNYIKTGQTGGASGSF